MTPGEIAYLGLVLCTFASFIAVVAYGSIVAPDRSALAQAQPEARQTEPHQHAA